MTRLVLAIAVALALDLGSAAAGRQLPSPRSNGEIRQLFETLKKHPMTFYVAKGSGDACGAGCDTWIAAEGQIDADAPDRLRRLLKGLGAHRPPIYFHSPGGLVEKGMEIGRILRKYKMTAGVALTVPQGCADEAPQADACQKLKRTGQLLPAVLQETRGLCASACVLALSGAATRLVPPGATIGVHAAMPVVRDRSGHFSPGSTGAARRMTSVSKHYVAAMGIDAGLIDAANSVSFDNVRILNRDEIARFKLDTRQFSETGWTLTQVNGNRLAVKAIVQEDTQIGKLQSRTLAVGCVRARSALMLLYLRDESPPAIDEADAHIGAYRVALKSVRKLVPSGKDVKAGLIAPGRLLAARTLQSIEVTEQQQSAMSTYKMSTAGLAGALEALMNYCNMSGAKAQRSQTYDAPPPAVGSSLVPDQRP